jgi:hypothetical protein
VTPLRSVNHQVEPNVGALGGLAPTSSQTSWPEVQGGFEVRGFPPRRLRPPLYCFKPPLPSATAPPPPPRPARNEVRQARQSGQVISRRAGRRRTCHPRAAGPNLPRSGGARRGPAMEPPSHLDSSISPGVRPVDAYAKPSFATPTFHCLCTSPHRPFAPQPPSRVRKSVTKLALDGVPILIGRRHNPTNELR